MSTDLPPPVHGRPRGDMLLAAGLAGALVALYASVLRGLVSDWLHDPNYTHGLLAVPAAAWLLWRRREALRSVERRPSYAGAVIVAASLALFLAGQAAVEFFVTRVSLLGVLAGVIVQLAGWQQLRLCLFPLCLIGLAIPLPALVFNQIAFPLQLLASRCGELALEIARVPVVREGNVIRLDRATLEVAEACSGVRSLMSLGTFALVSGSFGRQTPLARGLVLASVVPIVLVANGLRVAGAGVLAHRYGGEMAEGFLHTFSGWLFFGAAVLLLFGAERLVSEWTRSARTPTDSAGVA